LLVVVYINVHLWLLDLSPSVPIVIHKNIRPSTSSYIDETNATNNKNKQHQLNNSRLPKRLIVVAGLESSGTTAVAGLIAKALNISYRDGRSQYFQKVLQPSYSARLAHRHRNFPKGMAHKPDHPKIEIYNATEMEWVSTPARMKQSGREVYYPVEVLHVSLPQGGFCLNETEFRDKNLKIDPPIDERIESVIYPVDCIAHESLGYNIPERKERKRKPQERRLKPSSHKNRNKQRVPEWCGGVEMEDEYGKRIGHKMWSRFILNLTSHFQWYEERGTEVTLVILTRDTTIAMVARQRSGHCTNKTQNLYEAKVGSNIIKEAAHYLLESRDPGYPSPLLPVHQSGGWNISNIRTWYDEKIDKVRNSERLVMLSYEGMTMLEEVTVPMLFHSLGIDKENSTYPLHNANKKYVKSDFL